MTDPAEAYDDMSLFLACPACGRLVPLERQPDNECCGGRHWRAGCCGGHVGAVTHYESCPVKPLVPGRAPAPVALARPPEEVEERVRRNVMRDYDEYHGTGPAAS